MSILRLYAGSLTLAVWAIAWAAGVRGEIVLGAFVALASIGFLVSQKESVRRWEMWR
jgi:hypothetical protein